jgi:hypothetical protein
LDSRRQALFERPFCRALMRLGYRDATARRDEIVAFLRPYAAAQATHRTEVASTQPDAREANAL